MKIPFVFRKCKKCGRWLVANTFNFHRDKNGKYGLKAQCKECKNFYDKKYYEEHKESYAKRGKKYYKENKEYFVEHNKTYYEENKEELVKRSREYREENKEELAKKKRIYNKTSQGQVAIFNGNTKRRKREQQGNGITPDQWLEMMNFFDWKCAYSGKSINVKENRTIDHIVPLAKGGAHEIWNCVPMDKSLNSSKHDKDLEEWYLQQDFCSEAKVDKIYEWIKYAYNKWSNNETYKTI